MKIFGIAFATFAALVSGSAFAEMPHIKNITINPTPPGAKVSAAYLTLHNPGNEVLTLSEVSSPAIGRVEIHKTEIVDDVAKMRKQDAVELAADETVQFTHGGYHIMLMDLEGPLLPGDLIPLVFHTNHGEVTIDVRVADDIALPKDGHGDMNHGEMKPKEMDHGDMGDKDMETKVDAEKTNSEHKH